MIPFFVTVDTQHSTYSYWLVAEELILFAQYIYLKKNITKGLAVLILTIRPPICYFNSFVPG